jgi:hypothetical protein
MTRSVDDLVAALRSLEPTDDESDNVHRLNEAFADLHVLADREEALPEFFFLLERHPQAAFGAPIPLACELEKMPGYARQLAASLERQPTELAAMLANRLLNTRLPPAARAEWLRRLAAVTTHPRVPAGARESAIRYLDFQASRNPGALAG